MHRDQLIDCIEQCVVLLVLICVSATSFCLFIWELYHWPELKDYVIKNAITLKDQTQILKGMIFSFLAIAPPTIGILNRFKTDTVKTTVHALLKILSFLFLLPILFNKDLWGMIPFTMVTIVIMVVLYVYHIFKKIEPPHIVHFKKNPIIIKIITYTALVSLIGYACYFLLYHWSELKALPNNNAFPQQELKQILKRTLFSFVFMPPVIAGILYQLKNDPIKIKTITILRVLPFFFLIPFLLYKDIWRTMPFLMVIITSLSAFYLFYISQGIEIPSIFSLNRYSIVSKIKAYTILILVILGYTCYFSYYTILNHYHFQTHTFDLGLFQNAFINTLHGHFMVVSYFNGQSIFRDHCDFILLLYLPFFYLFPKTETFLILQSLFIALAALPLFLLCKRTLKSYFASLLIVSAFLLHPANHGANFYDFHQLAFLPLCVFLFFYSLEMENTLNFILSVFLLLSIKADMFLLLLFLSFFIFFNNKKHFKFTMYCLLASILYEILFGFLFKKWILHPFFFYYNGIMVDKSGGLGAILKTIITNPLYTLKTALTEDRVLYFCQLFGPLAFVPLIRKRNYFLFIYGLAITLLADRAEIHQIYFQYVWYIVPFLFVGLIYVLKDVQTNENIEITQQKKPHNTVLPILIVIFFTTFIYSWQYGAILNRKDFIGGFHQINFEFTPEDKKRLQILDDMIAQIPVNASVSASETISPHFLKHPNMQRFLNLNTEPDYLLLDVNDRPHYVEYLESKHGYKVIDKRGGFQLLKKVIKK